MNVVLYTIHCPACNVLRKKLDQANIKYELVDNVEVLTRLGYKVFPVLNVDGEDLNLGKANEWIKEKTANV